VAVAGEDAVEEVALAEEAVDAGAAEVAVEVTVVVLGLRW
jgi:hypothetical protein